MHAININQFENLTTGQIGPIKQVNDGVYTAAALAPTGEQMYFAMESIREWVKRSQ